MLDKIEDLLAYLFELNKNGQGSPVQNRAAVGMIHLRDELESMSRVDGESEEEVPLVYIGQGDDSRFIMEDDV